MNDKLNDIYTLGIDVGSTTSKCVILKNGTEIVEKTLEVAGIGTSGVDVAIENILNNANMSKESIASTMVTGYGRKLFEDEALSNLKAMSELSCHALGAYIMIPGVHTVIDIGGQDAKVISIGVNGTMSNFAMNDKCAAGTGRFLDVMATILKLDISELEVQAALADNPASISSTCTVFAESEVISQLSKGCSIPNVVGGICNSVASRICGFARRIGVKELVCMSGGVAHNGGVRTAIEKELGMEVIYHPDAQIFGALGAAAYAYKKIQN